jgi:uncharacterized membrane protein YphA (DoxX/SURF4 family)
MQILLFIATLIVGSVLGVIIKPKAKFDQQLSVVYVIVAVLLCFNSALVNFVDIQNKTILNSLLFVLNWGKSLSYLFIGYLSIHILYSLSSNNTSPLNYQLNKIVRSTLWAISIINGFGFIIETGYKIKNFDDLVSQFASFGYAVWFLCFIMVTETLGGILVLLHFKLKTGPIAAVALMIIMLGVVYSDWHKGNPFAFSYPAVDAFMSLSLMLVIYCFEKRAMKTVK